jgi:hypothetical protein
MPNQGSKNPRVYSGSINDFLSKFSPQGDLETEQSSNVLSASAPNALAGFLDQFTTLTESYWFYNHTEELRYNTQEHKYYRVDPELGNLIELQGVTTVLKVIDRSAALVPWGAKMVVEKLLRLIPLKGEDESHSPMLAPMTLEDFTKIAMDAKTAPRDRLVEAGDIGHIAHQCLEDSINYAIDHTNGVVLELREIPKDEKAKSCSEAGFAWMKAHNVRWLCTERKIYSKKHAYAGTTDGLAWIDSCDNLSCCSEKYVDHLGLVDWKSSNDLHTEYCLQCAAYLQALIEEFRS